MNPRGAQEFTFGSQHGLYQIARFGSLYWRCPEYG